MDIFQNPALVKQAIEQEKKNRRFNETGGDPTLMLLSRSAEGVGNGVANILGRPQPEDPRLAQVQQAQQAVQGIDMTNPKGMMEAAKKLNDIGMTSEAVQLATKAKEIQQKDLISASQYNNSIRTSNDATTLQKNMEWAESIKDPKLRQQVKDKILSTSKSTNVNINTGDNIPLTGSAETTAQKEIMMMDDADARLGEIIEAYDPKFLQTFDKMGYFFDAGKEKLGIELSEEDEADLAKFSDFKASAADNMNRYIKFITGAQMSEKEANRLLKAIPVPGDGFFDGDSPTQFKAKMLRQQRDLKSASARYRFLLQHGIVVDGETEFNNDLAAKYSLSDFKKAQKAIEDGANAEEVYKHMAKEYGLAGI